MEKKEENTGVIITSPRITDWQAGGETGIVYQELRPCGQWDDSLPEDEYQRMYELDVFGCVSFSALNCVEVQVNFMLANNLLPKETVNAIRELGFIENGRFNASDRFTAKMSGTTSRGNSLPAVWDSIRNDGMLPEKDWPFPNLDYARTHQEKWNEYYKEIPQELKDKAKKIKDFLEIQYEWIAINTIYGTPTEAIKKHLKHAPIQIVGPICPPWSANDDDPPIMACGKVNTEHATTIYGFKDLEYFKDLDHYKSTRKKLAWNYMIPYAVKGVVTLKKLSPALPFSYAFRRDMIYGERSAEVVKLQDALRADGVFPKNVRSTGFYGDITRYAVLNFQLKHKVASDVEIYGLNGRRAGPKTREKLNQIFNR